jgi:hypothetical protein
MSEGGPVVTIVRRSDAQLDVCPRCALYAKLLDVLKSRTQGLQLSLFSHQIRKIA